MKKNIILSAALFILCLSNLSAQDATVNARVTKSFEEKFIGASNIKWSTHEKGVALAKFRMGDETWLAYFNSEGSLITSGRKIKSADALPLKVKASLEAVETRYESKFGPLDQGGIYEMTGEYSTEYFVPLQNGQLAMMVSFTDDGGYAIRKKDKIASPIGADKSVIAKKN